MLFFSTDSSIDDWLAYLKFHNDRPRAVPASETHPTTCLVFEPPYVAETILKLCHQLKQPTGVMHRTLELYYDFYTVRCHHLAQTSVPKSAADENSNSAAEVDSDKWNEAITEMRHSCLFHLVSCLQIASKLESNYKV